MDSSAIRLSQRLGAKPRPKLVSGLTKKGNSYWGCCPFHSEKTPSFHVVPDRQMYKCFGCGKGGGAINFVMELENLPFKDAVALLAQRAGILWG